MAGSQSETMTDKQWNAILETIARRIENETGDERAAQIGLIGLGLGCDPGWDHGELWTTLPYMKSPLTSKVKSTLQWDKNYLTPWLSHRYHNVSSGDGRDGKRRQLSPMPPSQPHPGSLILAGKYGEPDFNGPSDPDWIRSKVK